MWMYCENEEGGFQGAACLHVGQEVVDVVRGMVAQQPQRLLRALAACPPRGPPLQAPPGGVQLHADALQALQVPEQAVVPRQHLRIRS